MRARLDHNKAALAYAAAVTVAVVAWGYLVKMAIDFGTRARDGDSGSWLFLVLAALGAMACLFLGMMLVSRFLDEVNQGRAERRQADRSSRTPSPRFTPRPEASAMSDDAQPASPAPPADTADLSDLTRRPDAVRPDPTPTAPLEPVPAAEPEPARLVPGPLGGAISRQRISRPLQATEPPPSLATATTPRASQTPPEPAPRRVADPNPAGARAAAEAEDAEPGRRAVRPEPPSSHSTLPESPTPRGRHAASGSFPPPAGPRPPGGKRAKR